MTEIKNVDYWEKSKELAEACGLIVPFMVKTTIGVFDYDGSISERYFLFQPFIKERPSGINRRVGFLATYHCLSGNFYYLSVSSPDIGKETLWPDSISQQDMPENPGIYPSFSYIWQGGYPNHPVTTIEENGSLMHLGIDLTERTSVDYYPGKDSIKQCYKNGDPELLEEMPDSIEGLDKIIGRPIPWQIDYNKHAKQILRRSFLKPFHTACVRK